MLADKENVRGGGSLEEKIYSLVLDILSLKVIENLQIHILNK